jgi:hypothetical protein
MEGEEKYWIENESIQCIIYDPPFGIHEETYDKHYARNQQNVVG